MEKRRVDRLEFVPAPEQDGADASVEAEGVQA